MATCFVYGTLMTEEVLARVLLGVKSLKGSGISYQDGTLHNYKRYRLKDRDYPGIMKVNNASVTGRLLFNVDAKGIEKLDHFEGNEYIRESVQVIAADGTTHTAGVYVWKDAELVLISEPDWDLAQFSQQNLHKWVADELAEVDGLGGRFWSSTMEATKG